MAQVNSWSELNNHGDWVLEKRVTKSGKVNRVLCCMNTLNKEENLNNLPDDLFDLLVQGGAKVVISGEWDD